VKGYLLDTNVISYWWDEGRPENASVVAHVQLLEAGTPLFVSAVSLGEIEFGHRVVSPAALPVQVQYMEFVQARLPYVLEVRKSTANPYGALRAALFERFAPVPKRKALRPEQLVDPISAAQLGIQENDVWIAAQAIEHNLVLVTNDKMSRLLEAAGGSLHLERWV
jgi:tRNA(fMet)-specific endonuclease VapC